MIDHTKPIDKLMDCQHVKRWTLICTVSPSTVASHSFNVAVLAMAIRHRMRTGAMLCSEAEICYYAMMHDVDEAETGDMPTPTKAAIRAAGVEPNTLYPTQGGVSKPTESVRGIVKLADLIDNYLFISQQGIGPRAAAAAAEVHGRLARAIDEAPEDMASAARWVWQYVEERRSDEDEERNRIEEDHQRRLRIAASSLRPVVGGKSRDVAGDS
jgi:hypothetical protein